MKKLSKLMAVQIAGAARAFQVLVSGHSPKRVGVVISENVLVVTLYGVLSPAEKVMAQTASGAAKVQEFHRQLFATSSERFRREIRRITRREVEEAAAEVEPPHGAVVHAFTSGN